MHADSKAQDFAGSICGRRYEKEQETQFRDCLLFYIDGKIRFEGYCYGESAGLVFSAWASGLDRQGKILWSKEPPYETQQRALPRCLTDIQNNGMTLQFDHSRRRFLFEEELAVDQSNGYGRLRLFFLRLTMRRNSSR